MGAESSSNSTAPPPMGGKDSIGINDTFNYGGGPRTLQMSDVQHIHHQPPRQRYDLSIQDPVDVSIPSHFLYTEFAPTYYSVEAALRKLVDREQLAQKVKECEADETLKQEWENLIIQRKRDWRLLQQQHQSPEVHIGKRGQEELIGGTTDQIARTQSVLQRATSMIKEKKTKYSLKTVKWFCKLFPCIWTILGFIIALTRVATQLYELLSGDASTEDSLYNLALSAGACATCLALFYKLDFLKMAWLRGYKHWEQCLFGWPIVCLGLFFPVFIATRCGDGGQFGFAMSVYVAVCVGAPFMAWFRYREEDLHKAQDAEKKALFDMQSRYTQYMAQIAHQKRFSSFCELLRVQLFDLVVLCFSAVSFALGSFVIGNGYADIFNEVFDFDGGDECGTGEDSDGNTLTNADYLGVIVTGCFVTASAMGKLGGAKWETRGPVFRAMFAFLLIVPALSITIYLFVSDLAFAIVTGFVVIVFYMYILWMILVAATEDDDIELWMTAKPKKK